MAYVMTDFVTMTLISVFFIGLFAWKKKKDVRSYIRSHLPDIWVELGMTDGLDENEIKKERLFAKYISSKSFVATGDEEFNCLCTSYIKWGRCFQASFMAWVIINVLLAVT